MTEDQANEMLELMNILIKKIDGLAAKLDKFNQKYEKDLTVEK